MTSLRLSQPPLLTTTIPTNDWMITGQAAPVGNPLVVDKTHRYSNYGGGIVATTRIPAGFPTSKFSNGVAAVVLHPKADEVINATISLRPPAGSVSEYGDGWTNTTQSLSHAYWQSIPYYAPAPVVTMGAQRLGTSIYAIANYTTAPDNEPYQAMSLIRVTDEGVCTVQEYTTNYWGYVPVWTSGQGDLFVSDDEHPFVWVRESYAGNEFVTGFWDNPSAFPADGDIYHPFLGYRRNTTLGGPVQQEGQLGAYRQQIPNADGLIASILVHPWSAGDYGAPELWHIVRLSGSEFEVYRGEWMSGAYATPPNYQWFDDSMTTNGNTTRYPRYNKHGYGFNMSCFNDANKVTAIKLTAPANTALLPDFRIMRDPLQTGVMHLVAVNAAVAGGGGGINV